MNLAIPKENLHLVREALIDFPRPDTLAEKLLQPWLKQHGIETSPWDIDVVTLHYQYPDVDDSTTLRIDALITRQLNLVEALLGNWQGEVAEGFQGFHFGDWAGLAPKAAVHLVDQLEKPGALANNKGYLIFNGLYRRTTPSSFGPHNRLPVRAEDFQGFIWKQHLSSHFKALLDTYWQQRRALYKRAMRINFIAACNRQVSQGKLSEAARLMAWQVAGLLPQTTGVQTVHMLDIYGYTSSTIFLIKDNHSPLTLLYIPGNTLPLHEFSDEAAMKRWIAGQCQNPDKREALLHHFAVADRPDGLDYSGLRTALQGLGLYPKSHRLSPFHQGFATSGIWNPQDMIGYRNHRYSPPITGELFEHLTQLQQHRSYADADTQITSNHDIDKTRWISYLHIALTLLTPVAIAVPELGLVLAVTELAQFSLGLDQTLHGKTLEQKVEGVSEQTIGLFNAVAATGSVLARPEALFRYCKPGFFSAARLAERAQTRIGAAPLPEELPLLPAEMAFREQPVQASTSVSALVVRIDENLQPRFAAWLNVEQGPPCDWVEYEARTDSFIRESESEQANPPRWIVDPDNPLALRLLGDAHATDDATRMASLRSLGIDLDLPMDYSAFDTLQMSPIPRRITSVWIGDRLIDDSFLDALTHNARVLHQSTFEYQLLLSRQVPHVFEQNVRLLARHAPNLQILTLEEQPWYLAFERSSYFPGYRAAIEGSGGMATNFSSASDILRYSLLSHYGGIYLDADDLLLPADASGQLPLERLKMQTSTDGLVLSPPVSNDQLGMYIKYNSSMIGSHPGNPTLDAISDEIVRRLQLEPDFYRQRPDPIRAPAAFNDYARRLNRLTGPGVLNDVIDQRLPWLRQLREACNLLASPVRDAVELVDMHKLLTVLERHVPLDHVALIGRAHSWMSH